MPQFPFGEFLPDQNPLGSKGVTVVDNAVPGPSGYQPVKSFSPASSPLPDDPDPPDPATPDDNRVQGANAALDYTQNVYQYCGTYNKLYLNADGVWSDASRIEYDNEVVTFNVDDTVSLTAHGLAANRRVVFATDGTLASPLEVGVTYYVSATDLLVNSFKISATSGGAVIDITDTGTGAQTMTVYGIYNGDAVTGRWGMVPWKNRMLATNGVDLIQSGQLGQASFENMITDDDGAGGNSLVATTIAIIRDFVVVGNTIDNIDGQRPSRVRWCAFNDEKDWVVSPATLSDFQDLKVSKVVRIIGGEYGVIFQTSRIWRMTFVGSPTAFQFDEISEGIGLIAPDACTRLGDSIYFWSYQGFYVIQGGQGVTNIGANKVDQHAITDLDLNYLSRVSCAADPSSQRIYWLYPGAGNEGGKPNRVLVYDVTTQRWGSVTEQLELIWVSGSTGVSIDSDENLAIGDPDDVDAGDSDESWDSNRWIGGTPNLAGFDYEQRSGFFTGAQKDATIITQEFSFSDGGRTRLNGFRPIVQGGIVKGSVGSRNDTGSVVPVYSIDRGVMPGGKIPLRSNARYHRFRVRLSGNWEHASGVQIDQTDIKSGGQRG